MFKIDESRLADFIKPDDWQGIEGELKAAWGKLIEKTGAGSEFLGWLDLPGKMIPRLPEIEEAARQIKEKSQILVCLGIGGSYLGGKAALTALEPGSNLKILFAGQNLSSAYLNRIISEISGCDFSLLVISKSGTTTETALAFAVLKELLNKKYGGKEAAKRIFVITDPVKGILREEAGRNGYTSFVMPPEVGGRFSVLTAVGLLPLAAAGIDINQVLQGARDCAAKSQNFDLSDNAALRYAAIRNLLYRQGKVVEIFSVFEPLLADIGEWLKQLFGESEGKDGKGIFPASCLFTTDLHSLGQYIQQGRRMLFETFLWVEKSRFEIAVPQLEGDLAYLAGKKFSQVNRMAYLGTAAAHQQGGVPNLTITIPEITPYYLGALFYFFELACGISGYLLGVNPFDQPGVEAYKKNMKELLEVKNG